MIKLEVYIMGMLFQGEQQDHFFTGLFELFILSDIKKIEFGKVVNKIVDVWLFEYDGEVDLGNATTDEVAQVAWMNREQIKELFDANMFVDTLEYFFTEVDKERS